MESVRLIFTFTPFRKWGAEIVEEEDKMICRCITPLHGAHIQLPFPSVGATENIILAASLAEGETIIGNAAREPEIVELCRFLLKVAGAKILAREPDESELWDRRNSAVFRGLYAVTGLCFFTFAMLVAGCGSSLTLRSEDLFGEKEREIWHCLGGEETREKHYVRLEKKDRQKLFLTLLPDHILHFLRMTSHCFFRFWQKQTG